MERPGLPARPRVLVVDDSSDLQRIVRARLAAEEIEFITAASADEGFARAVEVSPPVILLDIDLGGEDGLNLLRRLMADERTMHASVIMLSAHVDPAVKVTAFDLGAIDYITKPFEITELRVRLRSALRTQHLLKMLAQRAQLDGLTGLWNRAYFDQRWNEEFTRSRRQGHPLSVAMIDIDHFKSVNDQFGHHAGDAVLQGVGRVFQAHTRASDVPCRYGGEEFALIMPDTPPDAAATLCERVREAFAAVIWPRHPQRALTISVGVAGSKGRDLLSATAWVEQADHNLYQAKNGGRNRVVATDLARPDAPMILGPGTGVPRVA